MKTRCHSQHLSMKHTAVLQQTRAMVTGNMHTKTTEVWTFVF